MKLVFLILWLLYTLYSLLRNLRGKKTESLLAQTIQTVLIGLSLWYAWQSGVFSRKLWSPVDIVLGIFLGHILFFFSLMITHGRCDDVVRHTLNASGILQFLTSAPGVILRFLGIAAIEELVYRVTAQDILVKLTGSVPFAIGVSGICFCLLHAHFLRSGVISALEFMLFTAVLGFLYDFTLSFTLVTLIHLLRNLESAYLEFCTLLEETQDEAEALRQICTRHTSLVLESS